MAVYDYATTFTQLLQQKYAKELCSDALTQSNQQVKFINAQTIKLPRMAVTGYKDHTRTPGFNVGTLSNDWEAKKLEHDRDVEFWIDPMDKDETGGQLAAASALARQVREVVIPEVDTYVYGVMATGAGQKPEAVALTADNIYTEIIKASNALDNEEVPETGRIIVVTPDVYLLMKQCKDIVMETDIGNDLRLKGVISNLDGANVIKVPKKRLPTDFGFMVAHPVACVAPTKLEDYKTHQDPPGISGELVEGRICYDAFVLENKAKAIYYQTVTAASK